MKKTKLKKVIIGVSGVGIVGAGSGVASAMAATVSKEIKLVTQELWWSRGQFYSAFQDYQEALANFTAEWEEGTNQAVLQEDFINTIGYELNSAQTTRHNWGEQADKDRKKLSILKNVVSVLDVEINPVIISDLDESWEGSFDDKTRPSVSFKLLDKNTKITVLNSDGEKFELTLSPDTPERNAGIAGSVTLSPTKLAGPSLSRENIYLPEYAYRLNFNLSNVISHLVISPV